MTEGDVRIRLKEEKMKRGGFAVANPPLIRNGLFQKAEELEDEVPAFLYGGNLQFFIRGVNTRG